MAITYKAVLTNLLAMEGAQVQPPTATLPTHFAHLKGLGGVGGSRAGVPGTPTYMPQNDLLVALIIVWGFQKNFAPWGLIPAARFGVQEGGGQGSEKFSCFTHTFGFPMTAF